MEKINPLALKIGRKGNSNVRQLRLYLYCVFCFWRPRDLRFSSPCADLRNPWSYAAQTLPNDWAHLLTTTSP